MSEDPWLPLGAASRLVGVGPDTLRRWADSGKVESYTTPGGHRRFRETEVKALLASLTTPAPLDRSADRAARKNAG